MRYVPNTKAGRLAVQQADFKRLLDAGYSQEVYKGLNIFTKDEDRHFSLKVYKDAAAHPIANYYYRSADQRTKAIEDFKKGYDRRQAYKAEAKANPTKSTAANCAAAIREELKTVFPGIKFSVTSDNFAGGDAVRIAWNDGPTDPEVVAITGKYQYGQWNGMEDIYEHSNDRNDIPQTKFVTESRHMSPETRATLDPIAAKLFDSDHYRDSNTLWKLFQKTSFPAGAKITGIGETPEGEHRGFAEDFYCITFEAPEQKTPAPAPAAPVFEKVETVPGEINIIDYSERAFAVIGDTKPIKDKLYNLGGKFNKKLSCGPGWIFSKKRLDQVQKALQEPEPPPAPDPEPEGVPGTLQDEIKKTLDFFVDTDLKIHGHVTAGTIEAHRVQNVPLMYVNLEN